MRIAVNARFLTAQPGDFDWYLFDLLKEMADRYPALEIAFFLDRPVVIDLTGAKNIIALVAGPKVTGAVGRFWWNQFTFPRVIAKYKPGLVFEQAGYSSNIRKPGNILFHDKNRLSIPAGSVAGATKVIVFSDWEKEALANMYPGEAGRLYVARVTANALYKPAEWEQKEFCKQTYASGNEYLLVHAGTGVPKETLVNILKAFSLFKVRQRTSMKLVLYGRQGIQLTDEIKTYKFRDGVRLVEKLAAQHHAELVAGAYALLYPGGFPLPVAEALLCKVSVVAADTPEVQELTGGSVLVADFADPQNIAEQMKRIYKDEELRGKVANEGYAIASRHRRAKEVEKLWSFISAYVST